MVGVSCECIFPVSREEAFDACTSIENSADVVSGIERIEMLTDRPVGKGTKWRETRIMMKKEATETMWITEFDRPDRFVFEAESCGNHYVSEFLFTEHEEGTKVSLSFDGKPVTMMARLLIPMGYMMKGMARKMLLKDLEDIKASLEKNAAAKAEA